MLIENAERAFGPIDILINNAAITYFTPVADFTEKRFKLMMEVQVYAPFHLSQLVLPAMKATQVRLDREHLVAGRTPPKAALHGGRARRHGLRHVQGGAGAVHDRPGVGGL